MASAMVSFKTVSLLLITICHHCLFKPWGGESSQPAEGDAQEASKEERGGVQVQLGLSTEVSGGLTATLGENQSDALALAVTRCPLKPPPTRPAPPPLAGPQEPIQDQGPERAQECLPILKLPSAGYLHTEPEKVEIFSQSLLVEPGRREGQAPDLGTSDWTRQQVSSMSGAPLLPQGLREATCQPSGTRPEDIEKSHPASELLRRGPPQKEGWGQDRLGSEEEVDEDLTVDESSQDSPPSQASLTPGRAAPQAGSGSVCGETASVPGLPTEGSVPLPADFFSKVSAETQASQPEGPGTGPMEEGHEAAPEFTFHVEIKASTPKEQDLEGATVVGVPGEEQKAQTQGPSVGKGTKEASLQEPPGKQPAAGLPGRPVSRVPQLKGLWFTLPHSSPGTLQAVDTVTSFWPWLLHPEIPG
jgi:hypothetical protein